MSTQVTNSGTSNAELAAALADITKYLGDAEKNNVKADKNVLNHFLTVVQQYENQQQTEQANAPAIPSPPGTLAGDLKNGISVFGSSNEINISYIVSLVLALTSLESEQLAKQFELQSAANVLQYKAGVAAADDAQAAAVAGAVGSFTSAALSLGSLGLEALGAYKANSAGKAASAELTEESAKSGLSKEVDEAQDGTGTKASNEFELQNLSGSRSGKTTGNTGATETEVQNAKNQNQATAKTDNQGTARVEQSAARTRASVAQTERTSQLNATEAETSFNSLEPSEDSPTERSNSTTSTPNIRTVGSEEVRTTGSLFEEDSPAAESETEGLGANRTSSTEPNTGTTEAELQNTSNRNQSTSVPENPVGEKTEESGQTQGTSQNNKTSVRNGSNPTVPEKNPSGSDPASASTARRSGAQPTEDLPTTKAETPQPDQNAANQTTNPRAGTSDETRSAEQNSTVKTNSEESENIEKTEKSKPSSDFEKLARDLRKAIRPDLEQKVTKLDKLRAYDRAFERVNFRYSIGARGLQSAANSAQGAGQLAQGGLTKLQLVEQANAQLNSASSQSASQTIQQLQEVINNARNLVNGLLQSEFSVSRSA